MGLFHNYFNELGRGDQMLNGGNVITLICEWMLHDASFDDEFFKPELVTAIS